MMRWTWIDDVEMDEEMQIDQAPSHRRTYTFGYRSVSMEDVGQ